MTTLDNPQSPDERMQVFLDKHNADALSEEDDNGMQFLVLEDNGSRDERPVVLWIHPGDACEYDHPDQEVVDNARDFEHYMGLEIQERADTHRLVVLHRQSTPHAFEPDTCRVDEEYWDAMGVALSQPDTIHLWGDDLDRAGQWVLDQLGQAPEYFMTGAWSDPKYGCVAAVGKTLVRADKNVAISMWSPSEPGSVAKVWQPEDERAKIQAKAERVAERKRKATEKKLAATTAPESGETSPVVRRRTPT